ncbi:MAG TPA: flavodoxin family protein [Phycisphaerae bacterium]|nr:flavodoxin family protein [Phycisphaerae bacterium]
MVKAIGIAGSPRRAGNSTTLLEAALAGAASAGAETDIVYLNDLVFKGCQGCQPCTPDGQCRIRDALTPVFAALKLADVWMLASPIYFDGVSGQMKTFFDRCLWLTNERGQRKARLTGERRAAVIVTYEAGPSAGYRKVAQTLANYLGWMGEFGAVEVMSEANLGRSGAAKERPDLLAKATEMGQELVRSLGDV